MVCCVHDKNNTTALLQPAAGAGGAGQGQTPEQPPAPPPVPPPAMLVTVGSGGHIFSPDGCSPHPLREHQACPQDFEACPEQLHGDDPGCPWLQARLLCCRSECNVQPSRFRGKRVVLARTRAPAPQRCVVAFGAQPAKP